MLHNTETLGYQTRIDSFSMVVWSRDRYRIGSTPLHGGQLLALFIILDSSQLCRTVKVRFFSDFADVRDDEEINAIPSIRVVDDPVKTI
jgi:hypothetical protein